MYTHSFEGETQGQPTGKWYFLCCFGTMFSTVTVCTLLLFQVVPFPLLLEKNQVAVIMPLAITLLAAVPVGIPYLYWLCFVALRGQRAWGWLRQDQVEAALYLLQQQPGCLAIPPGHELNTLLFEDTVNLRRKKDVTAAFLTSGQIRWRKKQIQQLRACLFLGDPFALWGSAAVLGAFAISTGMHLFSLSAMEADYLQWLSAVLSYAGVVGVGVGLYRH